RRHRSARHQFAFGRRVHPVPLTSLVSEGWDVVGGVGWLGWGFGVGWGGCWSGGGGSGCSGSAGGAGEGEGAGVGLGQWPAGVVFEVVVVFAEQAEVAGGGGAEGPVDGVVEFAFLGWGVAAGGAAGAGSAPASVDS